MKLNKDDIGGKIISILIKAMYPGNIIRCMDFFDQSFIKDTVTSPEEKEQPAP